MASFERERDRASGWQHAKLSGHENEELLKEQMLSDPKEQAKFLKMIGKPQAHIKKVEVGGINEKNIKSVLANESTKSKTDMKVYLDDGTSYNISIKKSTSGQAYLISAEHFIRGMQSQYNISIPQNIKYAISLFWGSSPEIDNILKQYNTELAYETRKHRLVAETLKQYNQDLYDELIEWFKENAALIADFCLSKGLAKDEKEWADVLWYKNELGENDIDDIILIQDICDMVSEMAEEETKYGEKNGGTTIQLPFGFVQWHSPTKAIPGDMQFHHEYDKINSLLEKKKTKS